MDSFSYSSGMECIHQRHLQILPLQRTYFLQSRYVVKGEHQTIELIECHTDCKKIIKKKLCSAFSSVTQQRTDRQSIIGPFQVVTNACATQAILSVLLNSSGFDLGPILSEFKSFTEDFDPEMKGLALSNSHQLKTAHNFFKRQPMLELLQVSVAKPRERNHTVLMR